MSAAITDNGSCSMSWPDGRTMTVRQTYSRDYGHRLTVTDPDGRELMCVTRRSCKAAYDAINARIATAWKRHKHAAIAKAEGRS